MFSIAYAQDAAAATTQSSLMQFLPLIAIFAIFYFLMIRPQQKRAKEHRGLLNELKAGDEVLACGGIIGRVVKLDESRIELEIAPNVVIKVQKQTVAQLLPKGSYASATSNKG